MANAPCVAGLLCSRMDLSWITGYRCIKAVRILRKIVRFCAMDLMDATIKKQEWMADTNPGDIERNGGGGQNIEIALHWKPAVFPRVENILFNGFC